MQLDNFQKGKIRVSEVVLIHDENTKRLMWSTGIVLELRKSCDGLVCSVVLRSPNGYLINLAIQSLYPLEIRDYKKPKGRDVEEETRPEPAVVEPVETTIDPAPSGPAEPIADPLRRPELPHLVAAEVEPNGMGFGGEHVENLLIIPKRTTRSGLTSRPPQHLSDYYLRGPR
jgi:hypothetical protein